MPKFVFSFSPSGLEAKHDEVEISMSQVDNGYEFKCEDRISECVHPMSLAEVPGFLSEIGAAQDSDPLEVVQQMVEDGKARQIQKAIHAKLKPSFVWTSTDWS